MSQKIQIPASIRRIFTEGFQVSDIAEPLVSFDETTSSQVIRDFMETEGFDVVGIRINGRVSGFVERDTLNSEPSIASIHRFEEGILIPESAPLSVVVRILDREPRIFVVAFGGVAGIATRSDLEKASVRMWLFGMVTLIELRYGQLIEETCPNEAWRQYLSEGRLQKAEAFRAERIRRNRSVSLLSCLQLSDKGQIVARNEKLRSLTIFSSRSQAEEGIKMLEGLRNDLAHAQEIVSSNWEAIVRLAHHLEQISSEDSQ